MHKLSALSAAILAIASSVALAADETSTLEPVLVTATRLDVTNLPASVTVIDQKDIANSPAQTLPDLLELQAGVAGRSLYGNQAAADIDLRGFGAAGTQNTLILVDGRRLNDIDLSNVDFATIPLANIERIEIIRGGGAVLYGDGAVGGAINIVTRAPVAGPARGNVRIGAGSYDTRTIDAAASQWGDGYGFSIFGNSVDSNGYRANNALTQTNLQGDARYRRGANELFAKLSADKQDLRLPGARTVDPEAFGGAIDQLSNDRRGTSTPNDYATQDGHALTAGWSQSFAPGNQLIVDAGYRAKEQKSFYESQFSYLDTHLATWSVTPRYAGTYRLFGSQGHLNVGVDYYRSQYDSDRALSAADIATPIHRIDMDQHSSAAYGQANHTFGTGTSLLLGARRQQVKISGQDQYNASAPGAFEVSGAADFERKDTEPAYEAGLRQAFSPAWSGFVRTSRSVRFATVDELFELACDPITFACHSVFSPLRPQLARTREAGVDFVSGGYHVGLAAYAMNLTDEIAFDPINFTNENLDPTRRRGATVTAAVPVTKSVSVNGNYAYTRAEFRAGPNEGNEVPLVPRNTASVTLLADVLPSLSFATSARFVGDRRFDNDQSNTFAKMPSYSMVDMKITGKLDGWRLEGAINNVLNEKAFDYGVRSTFSNVRYNAYPLPERNYMVTVGRDF